MKRIKVSEASGAALDWLVAKCEGVALDHGLTDDERYSTNWAQGGPIIERERITLRVSTMPDTDWVALYNVPGQYHAHVRTKGPTALIAAMRCYVTSELGEEVEVPEELTDD